MLVWLCFQNFFNDNLQPLDLIFANPVLDILQICIAWKSKSLRSVEPVPQSWARKDLTSLQSVLEKVSETVAYKKGIDFFSCFVYFCLSLVSWLCWLFVSFGTLVFSAAASAFFCFFCFWLLVSWLLWFIGSMLQLLCRHRVKHNFEAISGPTKMIEKQEIQC